RPMILSLAMPALALVGACSSSRSELTVPLYFRPERQGPGHYWAVRPSPALRLFIAPLSDERTDKTKIGENHELSSKPTRPVFGSGPSRAEFVGSILSRELSSAGLTSVPDASQANRVLGVRLVQFYTTESTRYNSDVRIAAEVRDGSGRVLWSGQSAGHSD